MTIAYAISREEGEYADYCKDLLVIAMSLDAAAVEVKRQAEKFVEEQKAHIPHSIPIEILEYDNLHLTVRVGKMGWGPRDVEFFAEEAQLAGS